MSSLYENLAKSVGISDDEMLDTMRSIIITGKNTISLNHKTMRKNVDISWVDAIEEGLKHIDNVIRKPSRTIIDIEKVVPIALSKKITVESIKHLAQHTDLIKEYDPVTQKVTPSKVLNVYKEDSMMTYENKFVNTLIDRLYIFINLRYNKLKEITNDESSYLMNYNMNFVNDNGTKMKMNITLETNDNLEAETESSGNVWQRIERIKSTIEIYKTSSFCQNMGKAYIRPPVMRTNAILKNVDMKACLVLWQFIEGYDKIGYDMVVLDKAQKPSDSFISDFYTLSAINMLAFCSHTSKKNASDLRVKNTYYSPPKVLKVFNNDAPVDSNMTITEKVYRKSSYNKNNFVSEDEKQMEDEIDKIIATEIEFFKHEAEHRKIEKKKAEELRIRQQIEQNKLEEERRKAAEQAEKERLEQERIEAERLLEQRKKEQEEEMRLAREEQERKEREKAEQERLELERLAKERQEQSKREKALRKQFESEKADKNVVEETEEERLERETIERENAESEKRMQYEAKRAVRLRAERKILEKQEFKDIYFEYSNNPIIFIRRAVRNYLKHTGRLVIHQELLTDEQLTIMEINERCEAYKKEELEKLKLEKKQARKNKSKKNENKKDSQENSENN